MLSDEDYAALAKRAADSVVNVPESLRSVAFAKILDDLIAVKRAEEAPSRTGSHPGQSGHSAPRANASQQSAVDALLARAVDAAEFSSLFGSKGRLTEKALAVLRLAKNEVGADGLQATEIYDVLTKKFRVAGVHSSNLGADLRKSRQFFNRVQVGNRIKYLSTIAGEKHLDEVLKELA